MAGTISRKEWESLDKKSKDLIRKMGLEPEAVKKPTAPTKPRREIRLKKLAPYILCKVYKCRMCGSTTVTLWQMIPEENGKRYLVAHKLASGSPDKIESEPCNTCCKCFDKIMASWPKEIVVQQLLHTARFIDGCHLDGKMPEIVVKLEEEEVTITVED